MFIMPDPAAGLPDFAPLAGTIFETHEELAALDAHDAGAFAAVGDLIKNYKIHEDPECHAHWVDSFASGEIHANRARDRKRRKRR